MTPKNLSIGWYADSSGQKKCGKEHNRRIWNKRHILTTGDELTLMLQEENRALLQKIHLLAL